jgi:hypothetical protein
MVQLGIWRSMDKSVFPLHPPSSLMVCSLLLVYSGHMYLMHMIPLHTLPTFPFSFLFSFRTLYCYPPKKYLKTRHPGKPTMHESHIFKDPSHLMGGEVVVQTPDHPDEWVFAKYQAGTLVYQLVLVSKEPTILVWPESNITLLPVPAW